MRKAFTLVELLVVIAILGILAGFMLPRFNDAIETTREATCRANLKNLHTAAIDHANEYDPNDKHYNSDKRLPHASWWVYKRPDDIWVYAVHPGWMRTNMGGDDAPANPRDIAVGILSILERKTSIYSKIAFIDSTGRPMPL